MDLAVYLFPIWVAAQQPWVLVRVVSGILWLSLDFDVTRPRVTALVAAALLAAYFLSPMRLGFLHTNPDVGPPI
jgi:hypothetical protein